MLASRLPIALCCLSLACGSPEPKRPPAPLAPPPTASAKPVEAPQEKPALAQWGSSAVRFADEAEARALLGTSDGFTRAMSGFDRKARLSTDDEVDEARLLKHAAAQARSWPASTWERWQKAIVAVGGALEGLNIPLPDDVLFIATSGAEELDNPYTRGNAIIIPERAAIGIAKPFGLIAHELFHIISRHAPQRRDALYGLIGFKRVGTVAHPSFTVDRRLTNPDAYQNEHAILVTSGSRSFLAVPLIRAKAHALGKDVLSALEIYLVEVDDQGGTVRDADGAAQIHSVLATDYNDKAALNTTYAIHPEEVLADNFALLLSRRAGQEIAVDRPDVLDALEAELRK